MRPLATDVWATCPVCGDLNPPAAVYCQSETCDGRLIPYDPRPLKPRRINSATRARHGVTITFTTDEGPLTLAQTGPVQQAIRECIERAERLSSEPRVVCISTPETILRDLKGRDNDVQHRQGPALVSTMLTLAGRREYLAPELAALRHDKSVARDRRSGQQCA